MDLRPRRPGWLFRFVSFCFFFSHSLSEPPTQPRTTKSSRTLSLRRYGPQLRTAFIFIKALITCRVLREKQLGTLVTIRTSTCTVVTKSSSSWTQSYRKGTQLSPRFRLRASNNPGYIIVILDPCEEFSLFCRCPPQGGQGQLHCSSHRADRSVAQRHFSRVGN